MASWHDCLVKVCVRCMLVLQVQAPVGGGGRAEGPRGEKRPWQSVEDPPPPPPAGAFSSMKCFKCRQFGHKIADCPQNGGGGKKPRKGQKS